MSQLAAVFDTDAAVIAAHALARERFEAFAANDINDPPPEDPTDAMQIALMRWERARFGLVSNEQHALGVIEEMAETFLADLPTSTEGALDGLGDACVYAAQLCTGNRLAIAPILDLARVFTTRQDVKLITASGVLAQVVLKGAQKIRGLDDENRFRLRLVAAIAMCIAKTIDDVELIHDVRVKPAKVMCVVGAEVLARGAGHDAIPKAVIPERTRTLVTPEEREQAKHERRNAAAERMTEVLGDYDPATDAPVCLTCGADLASMGDQDLFQCGKNAEHVFTGKQIAAHRTDGSFDQSEIDTKPE